jgi:prevent-host-death family protein
MTSSYSIAEAKNRLPELVREVENKGAVQITRRGIPVVVVLSIHEYEQTKKNEFDFWEAYLAFRKEHRLDEIDLDPDTIFADVRDRSPGRDISWE